jgi:hypothetical protein
VSSLTLENGVKEGHFRGLTREEAELAYLNECKGLAMYGVHLFPAKVLLINGFSWMNPAC